MVYYYFIDIIILILSEIEDGSETCYNVWFGDWDSNKNTRLGGGKHYDFHWE